MRQYIQDARNINSNPVCLASFMISLDATQNLRFERIARTILFYLKYSGLASLRTTQLCSNAPKNLRVLLYHITSAYDHLNGFQGSLHLNVFPISDRLINFLMPLSCQKVKTLRHGVCLTLSGRLKMK